MSPVRAVLVPALLGAALLSCAGCGGAEERDGRAQAAENGPAEDELPGEPVRIEVRAESTEVALGEELVLRLTLTNGGAKAVRVNEPVIADRSVTLRLRRHEPAEEGQGGRIVEVSRRLVKEQRGLLPEPAAPAVKTLEPGASLAGEVRTVAVAVGEFTVVPIYRYQGALGPLLGDPIEFRVVPKEGRRRLGVRLETTHGTLVAELRPDLAYNTVESFASLVERGFYDGLTFHRVIPGFMAQGGDPSGEGWGGPGYQLEPEFHRQLVHERGVLSMARMAAPDSAGSQFFVVFGRPAHLDGQYTIFGRALDTEAVAETLERIESVGSESGATSEPVRIEDAELVTLE